jgi:hypothetical protein
MQKEASSEMHQIQVWWRLYIVESMPVCAVCDLIRCVSVQQKSRQHPDFPGGHPPEYYPSLRMLNFAERTGYGVFSLRWPSTKGYLSQRY